MREIKFRGKRLDNGEWLYGNLVELRNPFNPNDAPACFIMPKEANIATPDSMAKQDVVDPDTVGQFTGLLDKNGKEIYEGDIVTQTWGSPHFVNGILCDCFGRIGDVRYECDLIGVHTKNGLYRIVGSGISNTVIGNIHDNPELLSNDEHDPGTSVN